MTYKYQKEIDQLLADGFMMPEVYPIVPCDCYRFAFENSPDKNHIPQYINNPKRILTDINRNKAKVTLLALSCFQQKEKAIVRFEELKKSIPQIGKTVGDSLFGGYITESDGMVTSPNEDTHFNLFESDTCDLNQTFIYLKSLL